MVSTFVYYAIPTILVLAGIRKYRELKWGRCRNKVKLTGKVVIVTGANSGIGYEIAKEMAIREAQVIMACRNLDAAAKAIRELKQEIKGSSVIVPMELDLGSIRSIKNFAEEIKSTYSKVDILINNAGVSFPANARPKTKDGFEIHFGVNHLGHFLLTTLLLEVLKKAESSRIVIVSSLLHERGKLYLDDLNLENVMEKTDAYANSKLANVYFCNELSQRLKDSRINVYAACPGWVYSNLFRHYERKWYHIFIFPIALLYMRSPKQGAQTAIYCATEPELINETGFVYRDCKKYFSKVTFDASISKRLWETSENMIREIDRRLTQRGLYDVPFTHQALNY